LITLDSEHLGIPETSYTSEITMNSGEFTKLCRELGSLSETGKFHRLICFEVTFEISNYYLKFRVEGEVGNGEIMIKTGGESDMKEDEDNSAFNLSFALRYLNLFNKANVLSPDVKIMMACDTPLVVQYTVENLGVLKYYLAPKIADQ